MIKVRDLRELFIEFFGQRDHKILPSSSLVPKDDPTLLFTTAGMVQFKPMFAGTVKPDYTRAATIQKCLRTSDLENVGKTRRHCTFFEMLGNFSFGDYFKEEAIRYAWDYSVDTIGFPKKDIWISIYEDDDEAFEIWHRQIGVPADKIVRLGKKDNFWGPAGDSGACGPCSELYLDRGTAFGCGSPDCKPGCDCERFLEYWNLVFNQFYQNEKGELSPLPQTGIDTGMGLERLATLVQNVDSIYWTDELYSLVEFICRAAKIEYTGENVMPVNVLVEHARALTFAISDGVYPSNDGRGYVLRRILRRALRFGRQIGIHEPFVYKLVEPIVGIMGDFYPEIRSGAKNVQLLLEGEEKRFLDTLENGMDRLEEIMKSLQKSGGDTIPGRDAFVLYDTFGFPMEMTTEIALEKNLRVDADGFNEEMEKQRQRGKQSWKAGDAGFEKIYETLSRNAGETVFLGYEEYTADSEIVGLATPDTSVGELAAGQRGMVVTRVSAFYGESGGQVGDEGIIRSHDGAVFRVEDTKKINKTIIHVGELTGGTLHTGDRVSTEVDVIRRNLIKANHTATHLLQAALRKVLGDHVRQSGSLVDPEHLRFDFTHFKALSENEISEIEKIVNDVIWEHLPVDVEVKPIDEAVKSGAMAVFDEKYEDMVRVVRVRNFSMELCGGTHMDNTGKIGVFKITREASPGAGMRRIEAITLKEVLERFNSQQQLLTNITRELNVTEAELPKKLHELTEQLRSLEKELHKQKSEKLAGNIDEILSGAGTVKTTKVITHDAGTADADELRRISDLVRAREKDSLVCLGSSTDGRALLLCAATQTAVSHGIDCGGIIKKISPLVGGGGGGRKDMAQAGGKNPGGVRDALAQVAGIARTMIK